MEEIQNILNRTKDYGLNFTLQEIINNVNIKSVLSKIIDSNELLSQIAENSYSHENGFDKIVLCSQNGLKLRLHCWLQSRIDYTENIHNHRWDFCSYIISGSYISQVYVPSLFGEFKNEYFYLPRLNKEEYYLKLVGNKKLMLEEEINYKTGDFTFCSKETLHRVITNKKEDTITLFLQGDTEKEASNVYSENLIREKNISKSMNIKELEQKLTYIKTKF